MESNQNFGIGQEIISSDLNQIPSRLERGIYDYVIKEILGRNTDAFFQDSFAPIFLDSASMTVKSGLGFQNLAGANTEPANKPIFRETNSIINFDGPDATNDRIDIVVVQAQVVDGETVVRKKKDPNTQQVSDATFVGSRKWFASLVVVQGTAAPTPVAPATPAGYIKIHEVVVSAATGIADQNAITDLRNSLPLCTQTSTVGSYEYDAVVGSIPQANYSTLEAALIAAQDGWKILVLDNQVINTGSVPTVTNNNIEIIFKKGVTFSKGTSTVGMIIQGDFCKIREATFKDFSVGGDYGLRLDGCNWADVTGLKYENCDGTFDNQGDDTIHLYSINI